MTRLALRQGQRLFVHVPRSRATVAAGLTQLNGLQVVLVRRSTFDEAPCWVVDPPLTTAFLEAAKDPTGRDLLAGHRVTLPGLPEAWMTARAPTWSTKELDYLRDTYGTAPTAQIAEDLGRGLAAVRSKIEDLHLRCRTVWTPELNEILAELFPDTAATELEPMLGITAAAIRAQAVRLGISKDPDFAARHSRASTLARSLFTPEISEVVELLYPDTLTEDIACLIGLPRDRVHAYASARGWKKTKQFMRDTSKARTGPDHPMRRYQFPKGHVPANKGVKGVNHPGMQATQFRKGQVPLRWVPVGVMVVDSDGYLKQKVSDLGYGPDDWLFVHRLVWTAAHGPIPPGHVVRFKPGMKTTDPARITVDVLECISLADNARRNAWHANVPPQLRKVKSAELALRRLINRKQEELAHE